MRDGWRRTTIGEISRVVGGSTPSTRSPDLWGGGIPWITPGEVTAQEGRRIARTSRTVSEAGLASIGGRLLPAGTVLLTSRATVGAVALAAVPMAVNQGFAAMIAGPDVLPEWLMLWCQLNRPRFEALAGGSTFPEVSKPKVRAVELDLPPLAEQRRIVDLVAAADDQADACRRLITKVTDVYNSMLDDLYREALATGPLVPLGDVAATRLGKMLDAKRLNGDAYPYLANVNVQWDDVRTDELKLVPLTGRERAELALVAGDVLICEGGEAGRTAVLAHDMPGVYFQKAVHRVRCGPMLQPRFLMHFMRYATRNGLLDQFLSTLTIQHLTGEKLRRIPVPLPPIAVQAQAIATLDAASSVARGANRCGAETDMARTAISADLFSGKHEIPPSYDRFLDGAA
ncbi:MAG: restriction endonuclease subunit S [Candidatus Limnocylindrales bacterium]